MISIVCLGARGEFQTFIALAQQLKKMDKEVKIIGLTKFKKIVESYNIEFSPVEVDYEAIGGNEEVLNKVSSADSKLKMLASFNNMKKLGPKIADEMYLALKGSELIVYNPAAVIGYFAAEQMGIPAVLASPFPIHKTEDYLSVISYGRSKESKFNISNSYKILHGIFWFMSSSQVKDYWKLKFNKLPENFKKPYENISEEHQAIISHSNYVFVRPNDWDENIHQDGYWFVEEEKPYVPDEKLSRFLNFGEEPIYFGFGIAYRDNIKDWFLDSILPAIESSNKRAIISGMGEIKNLPPNVIAVDDIPHSWLFDKVSLVCHHGGAGTTAAAFRAGKPSVIVPFSNDQFAWAHRAYDLGVASKPIYSKDLNSDSLAKAIDFALQGYVVENARKLGENVRKEKGAYEAAKVIMNILK